MFIMFNRMAIRTQYYKIIFCIILSVSINMMNTKNSWNFVISTFKTFFYQSIFFHFFSNQRIGINMFFPIYLVVAFSRTIFSFSRFRIKKFFIAVKTCKRSFSSCNLRFMIAFSRTILSRVCTRRYMCKFFSTNFAVFFNVNSNVQSSTFSRTIFKRISSIIWYLAFFKTMQTFQNFTRKGFHYASN